VLEFPDVSHYQTGLALTGAQAVIAKATQGTTFTDPTYAGFRAAAASIGAVFAAYHWVDTSDLAAQAAHAYAVIGPTPTMWDAEADGATVPRLLELTARYRALGGVAALVYLPHWWWQGHIGAPDLRPLQEAGLALVSSDYRASPVDAGWQPYGGVAPSIWQFTDAQPFNGQNVDFNRFNGTPAQLAALFTGAQTQEDTMLIFVHRPGDPPDRVWRCNGVHRSLVPVGKLINTGYSVAGLWNPAVRDVGLQGPTSLGPPHVTVYETDPDFFGAEVVAAAPVIPTPQQIATAVVDLEHDRLAN
jgi:hypothetical protein